MSYQRRTRPADLWIVCLLMVFSWLAGCATMETSTERELRRQWSCDRDADAAVDRQQWDIALSRHQALLNRDPNNCLAIYHLGYIHGKLDDRPQEAIFYEKAIDCGLEGDDRLYFNLGMAYGEMNRIDDALSAFEQAISLDHQNAENYFGLGLVATWDGQTERAENALIQSVNLDPRHWEAHILLTRIYLDTGRLDDAQPHLEYLLANVPDHEDVQELKRIYEDRRITAFE